MNYRITGLPAEAFEARFAMTDRQLQDRGIVVQYADDSDPGFPCRVSLDHAQPGERLLLLNYEHLPTSSPYRSSHAIYVAERSRERYDRVGEIPQPIRRRLLSMRAFDAQDMMVDAAVVDGGVAEQGILRLLGREDVAYLHVHFAMRGCYAARVERVST